MSTYEYDLKYVKTYMSKSDCIEIRSHDFHSK